MILSFLDHYQYTFDLLVPWSSSFPCCPAPPILRRAYRYRNTGMQDSIKRCVLVVGIINEAVQQQESNESTD